MHLSMRKSYHHWLVLPTFPLAGNLLEGFPSTFQSGLLPGKGLPAPDCHIHVQGIDLDSQAHPPAGLRRNQTGPGTGEGLVYCLTRTCVVLHRPAYGLHGLLGAVARVVLAVLDAPQSGLLPIAAPCPVLPFRTTYQHGSCCQWMLRTAMCFGYRLDGNRG